MNKNIQDIGIVAVIAIMAWLFFQRKVTTTQPFAVSDQNAPYFLTANYPAGFINNTMSLLPSNTVTNEYTPTNTCALCSLFPTAQTNL